MPRKPEININFVDDHGQLRVVDTLELTRLLGRKEIVFDKVLKEKNRFGHFYRRTS